MRRSRQRREAQPARRRRDERSFAAGPRSIVARRAMPSDKEIAEEWRRARSVREGQPSPRQGETGGTRARAREHEANRQRRWLRATAAFILSAHRRGRAPPGISGVRAKRKFLSGSTGPAAADILREKFLFSRRPRKFCKNPGPLCDGQFLSRPAGSRLFLHFKALKKRKC